MIAEQQPDFWCPNLYIILCARSRWQIRHNLFNQYGVADFLTVQLLLLSFETLQSGSYVLKHGAVFGLSFFEPGESRSDFLPEILQPMVSLEQTHQDQEEDGR